jgi:hypothetical protein
MLVRKPEGSSSTKFVLKLGGAWYAPVKFTADKYVWKDIGAEISRAAYYEAGMRDAPPAEGKLDRYFMRMWTQSEKRADGNTIVHLKLAFVPGDKGPLAVPAEVRADLSTLTGQPASPMSDDDVPAFVTESSLGDPSFKV